MSWSRSPNGSARPIIKALLGKAAVPDDSPYTTGGIGLLGTQPSQEAMEELRHAAHRRHARFPTSSSIPKPGQARGVQIDLDPMRIGLRYPVEVGLVGDSRRTLQALLPLLEPQRRPQLPREGAGRNEGVVAS